MLTIVTAGLIRRGLCRSDLGLAAAVVLLPVLPVLLSGGASRVGYLRIFDDRLVVQQMLLLRRGEVTEVVDLTMMTGGTRRTAAGVTVNDRKCAVRMTLVRRLFARGESPPDGRHVRPPYPGGGDRPAAEGDDEFHDEEQEQRLGGRPRCGRGLRRSQPRFPTPPFVEYRAGQADHHESVEAGENSEPREEELLTSVDLGRRLRQVSAPDEGIRVQGVDDGARRHRGSRHQECSHTDQEERHAQGEVHQLRPQNQDQQ